MRYRLAAPPLFTHACHCLDCQKKTGTAFAMTTLRPGTLDDTSIATPQAHIWVKRKQRWFVLPHGVPCFDENYTMEPVWPAASLADAHGRGERSPDIDTVISSSRRERSARRLALHRTVGDDAAERPKGRAT